jgi:hypothetical protein
VLNYSVCEFLKRTRCWGTPSLQLCGVVAVVTQFLAFLIPCSPLFLQCCPRCPIDSAKSVAPCHPNLIDCSFSRHSHRLTGHSSLMTPFTFRVPRFPYPESTRRDIHGFEEQIPCSTHSRRKKRFPKSSLRTSTCSSVFEMFFSSVLRS